MQVPAVDHLPTGATKKMTAITTQAGDMYRCTYFVAFKTKHGRDLLDTEELVHRLCEIVQQVVDDAYDSVNGWHANIDDLSVFPNHVYMTLSCTPTLGIYKLLARIRRHTSGKMRAEYKELNSRISNLWDTRLYVATLGKQDYPEAEMFLESLS